MERLPPLLRLLVGTLVLNLGLFAAQRWLGWPAAVRSIGGAVLLALGLLVLTGGAGGSHLLTRAQARTARREDVERYVEDRRPTLGAGASLIVAGAATFGLALLVP